MLDAFADRISKPRLVLTDKMLISLSKLLNTFLFTLLLSIDELYFRPLLDKFGLYLYLC